MRTLALVALACIGLSACDFSTGVLARYPPPPAGSFTAVSSRIAADGVTESVNGASVTPDFFRAYTLQSLIGRMFMPDDYAPSANRVVLLSEDLWRKRFGAGPDIIGRVIDIDGAPAVVVGVIPNTFQIPADAKFWLTARR